MTEESQQDEVHAAKCGRRSRNSYSYWWNAHDRLRGVHPKVSKYLQDKILKLNGGIHQELGRHMEARLLESELPGKFGVFWSQLAAEIEAFQLHLVIPTYGEGAGVLGKA